MKEVVHLEEIIVMYRGIEEELNMIIRVREKQCKCCESTLRIRSTYLIFEVPK